MSPNVFASLLASGTFPISYGTDLLLEHWEAAFNYFLKIIQSRKIRSSYKISPVTLNIFLLETVSHAARGGLELLFSQDDLELTILLCPRWITGITDVHLPHLVY